MNIKMPSDPHLLVAISSHGFGHTCQTAPVVNALRRRLPNLRISIRATVLCELLDARFEGEFTHISVASDFGMRMASAVNVLVEESAEAYAQFHSDWDVKIKQEADALAALAPDIILANVPYLTLAGAGRAGIPAYALCSLNWADIYRHYCGHRPEAAAIHAQILAAYNSAAGFLQTGPSMPMSDIARRYAIGPVASVGKNRRAEINKLLDLPAHERLVVIAPGGLAMRIPVDDWPRLPGLRWLVSSEWNIRHPDAVNLEVLGMHFIDILRSCDAMIGKPGYGSFAEAACNAVPMLYVKRHDWPEEPYLIDWLERHGRCLEIDRASLQRGDLREALSLLWDQPVPAPLVPRGIQQAADYLAAAFIGLEYRQDSMAQAVSKIP